MDSTKVNPDEVVLDMKSYQVQSCKYYEKGTKNPHHVEPKM